MVCNCIVMAQVPRLSSVLRAVLGQAPVDIDAHTLARQHALQSKPQFGSAAADAATEVGGIGQSPLPKLLFGAWDKGKSPNPRSMGPGASQEPSTQTSMLYGSVATLLVAGCRRLP